MSDSHLLITNLLLKILLYFLIVIFEIDSHFCFHWSNDFPFRSFRLILTRLEFTKNHLITLKGTNIMISILIMAKIYKKSPRGPIQLKNLLVIINTVISIFASGEQSLNTFHWTNRDPFRVNKS